MRAFRARRNPAAGQDGHPLPPPLLMIRVVGHADTEAFERYGRDAATIVRDTVAEAGVHTADMDAILDFGCGCGRVARHWPALGPPAKLYGCDCNASAIAWCQDHLPWLDARTNQLDPPLPYPAECFDLVYALSVFTHLGEAMRRSWMDELHRVLKPGGLLFFTIKGERHAREELDDEQHRRFATGEFVITYETVQGSNLCAAYANADWVTSNMLDGFELLTHRNQGHAMMGSQDTYLVRRA